MSAFPKCEHGKGDAMGFETCDACRIDDLERQVAGLEAELESQYDATCEQIKRCAAAENERDRLREDAERYQSVRRGVWTREVVQGIWGLMTEFTIRLPYVPGDFDTQKLLDIHAARQQEQPHVQ